MTGAEAVARSRLLSALTAVLVLAGACAVWFGIESQALRGGPSADNVALADPAATEEVIEQVSAALKTAFSYDYANLEPARRDIALALTGAAERAFHQHWPGIAKRAKAQKEVRASTVRSIGVRTLTDDRAVLLVFLDQQVLSARDGRTSSTSTLDVSAVGVDGSWQISVVSTL